MTAMIDRHRSRALVAVLLTLLAAGTAVAVAQDVRRIDVAKNAKAIKINGDWLAAGLGGVWLSGEEELYRLDPRTGRRVARIAVEQRPCQASEVGAGAVWSATCGVPGLARIDPETNRATHTELPVSVDYFGEGSIGVGAGGVWVVTDGPDCTACRVSRVDARSLEVTAEVEVPIGAAGVRFGAGSVWVTNPVEDVVHQIDPATAEVRRTVETRPGPLFFDVGLGAAWTLNQVDGTVTRVDARTGRTRTIRAGVVGEGGDLTVGAGSVWARGSDRLLVRIDAKRRRVVTRYGPPSGSGAVIVAAGAVWISAHDVPVVWRLPLRDA
jgi:streptogramin lyase